MNVDNSLFSIPFNMTSNHCTQSISHFKACLPPSEHFQSKQSLCSLGEILSFIYRELALTPLPIPGPRLGLYGAHLLTEGAVNYGCKNISHLNSPTEYVTEKVPDLMYDLMRKVVSSVFSYFPLTVENTFVNVGIRGAPELENGIVFMGNLALQATGAACIFSLELNHQYAKNLKVLEEIVLKAVENNDLEMLKQIMVSGVLTGLEKSDSERLANLILGRS